MTTLYNEWCFKTSRVLTTTSDHSEQTFYHDLISLFLCIKNYTLDIFAKLCLCFTSQTQICHHSHVNQRSN